MTSPIELLPNELLDEIISFLSSAPPSLTRLHQPPTDSITKSRDRDLKNLSLTCSRLLHLVRPWLFSHGCVDLDDGERYLAFLSESELGRYTTSVVVKTSEKFAYNCGMRWWRDLLYNLRPLRLTIVASPVALGRLLGIHIPREYIWAFEISHQILHLECDWRNFQYPEPGGYQSVDLLDCVPWSAMLYNESSSLKSYNHYEYFLYQVPSLFHRGSLLAVFPFYNHVQVVLDALEAMTNLHTLKIQLGPSLNDRVTEKEQRGSMDPSDPWMELATGYTLIANAVRNLGRKTFLSKLTSCDYAMEAIRAEIEVLMEGILRDSPWKHDGQGTWTKSDTIGHTKYQSTTDHGV
ncbi:hypothetical protein BJX70DRAFT_374410 [Aspergillus crustosus]